MASRYNMKGTEIMEGIDWEKYHQLCVEATDPTMERFADTLRRAVGVATEQSAPVYSGEMRGCLVTALRQMTDILKQFSQTQLSESQQSQINWKQTENRMREMYFLRLDEIKNMQIASEYVKERLRNTPTQKGQVYYWIHSLRNNKKEMERIIRRTSAETRAFSREDVQKILELELLGIKRPR